MHRLLPLAALVLIGCVRTNMSILDNARVVRLKPGMSKMHAFSLLDATMVAAPTQDGGSTWQFTSGRYTFGRGWRAARRLVLVFDANDRLLEHRVIDE